MAGKKKTLRTEPVVVKAPRQGPTCPMHSARMEYDPLRGLWHCTVDTCKQVAFPSSMVDKGKPVIGQGTLELLRVKDPDGSKAGRLLLRVAEQNIMIDVTDYVVALSDTHRQPMRLGLDITHFIDHLA